MEKNQIFYIITSNQYAKNNKFKIGGLSNISLLNEHLVQNFNIAKGSVDYFFNCYIEECNNYEKLQCAIKKIIAQYLDTNGSGFYILHYNILIKLIKYLSIHYNDENNYHQEIFDAIKKETPIDKSVILKPLICNELKIIQIKSENVVILQKISGESISKNEKNIFIENIIKEYFNK